MTPTSEPLPCTPQDQVSTQVSAWWLEAASCIRTGRFPRARRLLRWILAVSPNDRGAQLWLDHLSLAQGKSKGHNAALPLRPGPGRATTARTGIKLGLAIFLSVLGLALLPFLHPTYGTAEWRAMDTTSTDVQTPTPTSTPTPVQTEEIPCAELPEAGDPLAAQVGEQGIALAAYERDLAQFLDMLQASGVDLEATQTLADMPEYRRQILDSLIEDVVLQQAAVKAGISVSEVQIEDYLRAEVGSDEDWARLRRELEAQGQTWDEYLRKTCQAVLRQSVREQVTTEITGTVEMVWARQIVVRTQEDAQNALARLAAGEDFAELAEELSLDDATRDQGGDLGWFPQGFEQIPATIQEAAFSGSPGLVQGPILIDEQYYLVQTVDVQPDRPIDADLAAALRESEFERWLIDQVGATPVTIFVDLYGLPDGVATPEVVPPTGAALATPVWLAMVLVGLAFVLAGAALRMNLLVACREEVSKR